MTIYQIQTETKGKWTILDSVQDKQFAQRLARRYRRKGCPVKVVKITGD